jgi:hypothetical protein
MRLFACRVCQQTLYFESVQCTKCGRQLSYLPDQAQVCAIEPAPVANPALSAGVATGAMTGLVPPEPSPAVQTPEMPLWHAIGDGDRRYRLCKNSVDHGVCNWGVAAGDDSPYCLACRLNHMIPSLATAAAREAWHTLEMAKRRVLYTLFALSLPVEGRDKRPDGLQFDFLQDGTAPNEPRVYTGHNDGVITINVAEAGDPFREKVRVELGESYRTVLGHFRHEIGHYYWDRLIKKGTQLEPFRELFGDERPDYAEAQQRHYSQGAPPDWVSRFVSAYASMHPWEDWAETWAHYLHMVDTLETARAYGLSLTPVRESALGSGEPGLAAGRLNLHAFEDLIEGWVPLTVALNSLNRSMGVRDGYPFILSDMAIRKLKFVHEIVESKGGPKAAQQ